ncbi:hypothetical protein [Alterisphingorhabdus coralli]|uniref:Cell wall hydrolase n=1 Tax=Alterisphingorhabdus coralli TaxID=3071408 RepID=A0AA97F591_9SPHN|nr:hypothetical protein [Parasphingorhabdus sp. SCSIO 66989]WOE74579.1 hypothetical protein RB602_12080 [Parasphingorhabdus sp. SCSIO 66989]
MMIQQIFTIAALSVAVATPPLAAQDKTNSGDDTGAETPLTPEQEARRQANEQQAQMAREQVRRNVEGEAQYNAELAEQSDELIDRAGSLAEYDAAVKAYEKARADYEAAVKQWQADVAACEAGDRSRCAQPEAE